MSIHMSSRERKAIEKAQELLRKKNYDAAIIILEQLNVNNYGPAADLLGILYENGIGVSKNLDKAIEFYAKSREEGSPMGAYHLGLGLYKQGKYLEALNILGSLSDANPSAAFWSYRSAKKIESSPNRNSTAEVFLTKSSKMGHFGAKTVIASRYINGEHGYLMMPLGYLLKIKIFVHGLINLARGEKLKLY